VGSIIEEVLVKKALDRNIRNFAKANGDNEIYVEMEKNARYKDLNKNTEGTTFHSGNKRWRPSTGEFFRFFTVLGAFGLFLWAGGRIVTYYALWVPTLENFDYNHYQYTEALERYANILFAADAWGLFLVIVAIIGILTLIVMEQHR